MTIGREDPLWHDDVGRATWWVGAWWQRALRRLGWDHVEVHRGPMRRPPYAEQICFAGVGPGEVLVHGVKLVGVSQRRTRNAARFQTVALLHWDPTLLAALCRVTPLGQPLDPVLVASARGLAPLGIGEMTEALVAALP